MKKKVNLNGTWNFTVKGKKAKIKVPSNWYLQGHDFAGRAIYEREFSIRPVKGKDYFIVFKGADYFTEVFINGKPAGKHEGYFQPFKFNITGLVKEGKNSVSVAVNSPKESAKIWPDQKVLIKGIFNHHDARPGSWSKKYGQDKNTGGIWNDVFVGEAGSARIEGIKITPARRGNNWDVFLGISAVSKAGKSAIFEGEIKPLNFKGKAQKFSFRAALKKGVNSSIRKIRIKNPKMWWCSGYGPARLYKMSLRIKEQGGGEHTDTFGLRELRQGSDRNWYLNGVRIFIKGTNMIPTQWLSEYTPAMIKKDVSMIRAANINMIRIHAHVNREELYREFDRQGIMVWQDFALQWGYDRSKKFEKNAVRQLRDMMTLLYNRPSITIWCCHNEPYINEHELDPVLYSAAKKEDASRFIYKASDFSQHHYPGWYYDNTPYNFVPALETARKAGIITEYGAQALPCVSTMKKIFPGKGLFPPDYKKWEYHDFQYDQTFDIARVEKGKSLKEFVNNSQDYQAKLIKEQTEFFREYRYKGINGLLHFMYVECWPSITWAVVDYYRKPKKGYYALKQAFQPVLPCYKMMTKKIQRGYMIGWGNLWTMMYIINDTPGEIKGAGVTARLKDTSGKVYFKASRKVKRIKADGITSPFEKKFQMDSGDCENFRVPEKAKPGTHTLEITIKTAGGALLGKNSYEFLVTRGMKK